VNQSLQKTIPALPPKVSSPQQYPISAFHSKAGPWQQHKGATSPSQQYTATEVGPSLQKTFPALPPKAFSLSGSATLQYSITPTFNPSVSAPLQYSSTSTAAFNLSA
jgi:hypothetical protein